MCSEIESFPAASDSIVVDPVRKEATEIGFRTLRTCGRLVRWERVAAARCDDQLAQLERGETTGKLAARMACV